MSKYLLMILLFFGCSKIDVQKDIQKKHIQFYNVNPSQYEYKKVFVLFDNKELIDASKEFFLCGQNAIVYTDNENDFYLIYQDNNGNELIRYRFIHCYTKLYYIKQNLMIQE